MKRSISLLLCLGLLAGFSAYALGASAPDPYTEAIEEIQTLCEQEEYEEAYEMICSIPPCAETAALLEEMIEINMFDLDTLHADYKENSVRAEKEYVNKFYFLPGKVAGFDTAFLGEQYMKLDIEDVSEEVHCFDIEDTEMMSVNNGDDVIVAGHYSASWVWDVIDFKSCSIVDSAYLNAPESITEVKEGVADKTLSVTDGHSDSISCPNCGDL